MGKRTPPPAGYWIECGNSWDSKGAIISCGCTDHSQCGKLSTFLTTGTMKGMKYRHRRL